MLYPRLLLLEAIPKYISKRTSYHRVCLAFHPYPQLISSVFNHHEFGPPRSLTSASTWSWIDHSVSGLQPVTVALFRLAFATAPHSLNLATDHNSQAHYTKGSPSPRIKHGALNDCKQTVSGSISLPSQGYFSPFPHGTCALSICK